MSIIIMGKDKPVNCVKCDFRVNNTSYCRIEKTLCSPNSEPKEWCPLIELPPHGRLIDADAFERRCMFDSAVEDMQDTIYALRDFPTIIEAEWSGT